MRLTDPAISHKQKQFITNMIEKRFWLFIVSMILWLPGISQDVRTESGNINSKKYSGFSIRIEDKVEKVSEFWQDELKITSKTRRKRDFYEISEFQLPNEYNPEALFYTRVIERDSTSSKIWVTLDTETLLSGDDGVANVNRALQKYLSKMPLAYEKHLVEIKIEEAERAVEFTGKQKDKFLQDQRNFEFQLEESKSERERLLNTLEQLELEILATQQKIENSKIAADQADLDLIKINKVLNLNKSKLKELQN